MVHLVPNSLNDQSNKEKKSYKIIDILIKPISMLHQRLNKSHLKQEFGVITRLSISYSFHIFKTLIVFSVRVFRFQIRK